MDPLLAVQIANLALKGLIDAGISWASFRAAQDKARAEGRSLLTADELRGLVQSSQRVIDDL